MLQTSAAATAAATAVGTAAAAAVAVAVARAMPMGQWLLLQISACTREELPQGEQQAEGACNNSKGHRQNVLQNVRFRTLK